jgi:hypothetical protein
MSLPPGQPGTSFAAYKSFRSNLVAAAAFHIERIDPSYAANTRTALATVTDAQPLAALDALPAAAAERFSRFRRLLNAVYEVELYFRQVNAGVILLAVPGAHQLPAEIADMQVPESEQFFHHLQAWSMSLGSLFDRMDNLVTLAARQLIRPAPGWDSVDQRLKQAVRVGQDKHRTLRNSFAHQGGVFDQMASTGVWDQVAALGHWLSTSVACDAMYAEHVDYVNRTTLATATALQDIDAIFSDLDQSIDWEAVKLIRL